MATPAPLLINALTQTPQLSWKILPKIRGSVVFQQGDPASSMFVLQAGLVKLSRRVDSNRDLIVRVVRPGELFGDRVFAGESARECTAESLADCVVYEMAHEEFVTQCKEHPELWNWVAAQLERRIEEVERRLHLVSFCRVEQRILVLLADLASAFPDHETHGPQIPLAQAEIASLIGATRETTSSTLNQLERRGLLILGRRHVEVPSVQALRNAASSENHRSQV